MADNKNQAQLLEDYGSNVLAGASESSEDLFIVTFSPVEGEETLIANKTFAEVEQAIQNKLVVFKIVDNVSTVFSAFVFAAKDVDENNIYIAENVSCIPEMQTNTILISASRLTYSENNISYSDLAESVPIASAAQL